MRSNLSDELYNQYVMQLNTLEVKKQKNVMKNFHLKKCVIENVRFENNLYYVDVKLFITFKDYIVEGWRVVRGSAFKKCKAIYSLTFVSSNNMMNTCPHCGAHINNNSSQVCEYCKSTIVRISNKWVLTKKRIVSQFGYNNPVIYFIKGGFKNFFKIIKFIIQFALSVGIGLAMLGGSLYLLWILINIKL